MSKINRSAEQDRNLWEELFEKNAPLHKQALEFQAFIQAPNNAFLACEILQRFLQSEEYLRESSMTISALLNEYFTVAKHCLKAFKNHFSETSEEFNYLKLSTFLKLTHDEKYRKKNSSISAEETNEKTHEL